MDPLILPTATLQELISHLTPRQREVVALLAQGKGDKEAGQILSISPRTLQAHVYRACDRAGVENRVQLIVVYAMWQAVTLSVVPKADV